MNVPVTEEMIERQPPEAQAIIRSLLDVRKNQATIDALMVRVQVLEAAIHRRDP
jgi:hypothetical protein